LIARKKSQEKKISFITHTFIGTKRDVASTHAKKLLLYEQARGKSLRGVNSPGTRLISAGAKPFFITRTVGPYIYDPNGGNFIHSSCNSIQHVRAVPIG